MPQVVPKILMSSFSYLLKFKPEESKDHLTKCFGCCKELLQSYLNVIGTIKITTVLEDDMELLVGTCQDLVLFHETLIQLDVKLSLMVWKVYIKLTNKHMKKLVEVIELSLATEKISSVIRTNFIQLRRSLSSQEKDPNVVKVTMKVVNFLKALLLVAAQGVGRSKSFLGVLLELEVGLPSPPCWVPEVVKNNIIAVILSPEYRQTLLKQAAQEPFLSFLTEDQPEEDPGSLLQLTVELLLLRPPNSHALLRHSLKLVSAGGCGLDQAKLLEGRQNLLKPKPVMADRYTWTLTSLSIYLKTSDREEFTKIESILLSTLLDPSSSLESLMLVSDLWCFCARISSSSLCLSHMTLLRSVKDKLDSKGFTLTGLVIETLLARLSPFLSGSDSSHWKSLLEEDKVPVEDKWQRLSQGEYRPASSFSSTVNLTRLTEETVRLVPGLTEEKINKILLSFHHLVRRSGYRSDLTVTLLRLVRLTADKNKNSSTSVEILSDVSENLSENSVGGSSSLLQLSLAYQQLTVSAPPNITARLEGASREELLSDLQSDVWSEEKAKVFNNRVNFSASDGEPETEKENKDTGKSPESKRRKTSDEKENIELSVAKLEKEIIFLSQQDRSVLRPFSAAINNQQRRLQKLTERIGNL